jgi:type IV pilus assembly protein PilM
MSLVEKIRFLLNDPPPEFVFEFSETGIAWAQTGNSPNSGFQPLDPGVLAISPVKDNVLKPELLEQAVMRIVPEDRRRRPCAIILPDYSSRVAVLDFDSFPSEPAEQLSLVRFRVKKTVPFDLDAANVGFHVQPHAGGGKKRDVVVAVVSLEILARYEAPLRMAGLHPGLVTISALSALNMVQSAGLEIVAKLSGSALTVAVTDQNALRMYRCVELDELTANAVLAVLYPTYAYVEDEFKKKPERLLLCGFGSFGEIVGPGLEQELGTPVEPLRSPLGTLGTSNAGLLGYLAGVGINATGVAA